MGTQAGKDSKLGQERPGNHSPPSEGIRQQTHPPLLKQTHEEDRGKPVSIQMGGRTPSTSQGKEEIHSDLAHRNRTIQQRPILLSEEQFIEIMKEKGLDEWDINVALGGFKKGALSEYRPKDAQN